MIPGIQALRGQTAVVVDGALLDFADTWLRSIMEPSMPLPSIVPTNDGVQAEWHCNGIDLEIEIQAPPYRWIEWTAEHLATGIEAGGTHMDETHLKTWIHALSKKYKEVKP